MSSSKLCCLISIVFAIMIVELGTAVETGSVYYRTDVTTGKSGKTLVVFWNADDKTCFVSNITEFPIYTDGEKLGITIADLEKLNFRSTGQPVPRDLLPDQAKVKCEHSTMVAVERYHTGKSRLRRGASAMCYCRVICGSCYCCFAIIF